MTGQRSSDGEKCTQIPSETEKNPMWKAKFCFVGRPAGPKRTKNHVRRKEGNKKAAHQNVFPVKSNGL